MKESLFSGIFGGLLKTTDAPIPTFSKGGLVGMGEEPKPIVGRGSDGLWPHQRDFVSLLQKRDQGYRPTTRRMKISADTWTMLDDLERMRGLMDPRPKTPTVTIIVTAIDLATDKINMATVAVERFRAQLEKSRIR